MQIVPTLIFTMSASLLGSIIRKYYTQKTGGLTPIFLYNLVTGIVTAVILLLWGGLGTVSLFTALLGIVFGLVTNLQMIATFKGYETGPLSYTNLIISCSTVISALSGAIFWEEKLTWAHIVGLILMLASFALAVEKKEGEKSASTKWFLYCIFGFLGCGAIGVMQKVHQSSAYRGELNAFLIIAFATSFVFSTVYLLCVLGKRHKEGRALPKIERTHKILFALMLVSGGCVAVNNKLNLYLSGVMVSAVFFPIVNGGGLVLVTVAAVLLFRERLSKKQWIGVVFGMLSVLFLCNPFGA